jgi:hypothetical protein
MASNTISPETWAEMKEPISKLYTQEEWPLKQVIKKLKSDKFNPTSVYRAAARMSGC